MLQIQGEDSFVRIKFQKDTKNGISCEIALKSGKEVIKRVYAPSEIEEINETISKVVENFNEESPLIDNSLNDSLKIRFASGKGQFKFAIDAVFFKTLNLFDIISIHRYLHGWTIIGIVEDYKNEPVTPHVKSVSNVEPQKAQEKKQTQEPVEKPEPTKQPSEQPEQAKSFSENVIWMKK